MDAQIKSQILGLSLAIATAVGCVTYEKIVKNFSLSTIMFCATAFYAPMLVAFVVHDHATVISDVKRLFLDSRFKWYGIVYMLTWITTPLWFVITKNQSVMAGSLYEVKYIVILALFYVLFGDQKITVNTVLGACFAIASVYFVSKK